MGNNIAIGKRIQELRLKNGLSLTEVANRAGVAKSYISSVEREIQINPSIQFLEKVSNVLGISVDQLVNNKETEDSDPTTLLDEEWLELAKNAMESGVSKEQFRQFLEFQKWQQHNKN
ncbi:helix-turn-helix domain-containing protein [Bacillus massiliigorillae]|uniref:helix-turn-helix domain-containing protein n=1 Tax=Bacillus massiliigorillae TaxID=1243664 RepID=UPI0003A8F49C|nr:DNA-binding anti-repressor SinI [Bacillus massiliigorillae]